MSKEEILINFFLKNGNVLTKRTISELFEIDPYFDLNRFDLSKTKIEVLYLPIDYVERMRGVKSFETKVLKKNNSYSHSIHFPFKFKRKRDTKFQTDMNIFFTEIEDVIYIEELKERNIYYYDNNKYNTKQEIFYFHVKYQENKNNKNRKTFRFLLNSKDEIATNIIQWKYFIDGVQIEDNIFERKLKMKNFV